MAERENILVYGKRWKDWQYRNTANKVFASSQMVDSFKIGCEMILNGEKHEGVIEFFRSGLILVRRA
jgi:hypothetical protein